MGDSFDTGAEEAPEGKNCGLAGWTGESPQEAEINQVFLLTQVMYKAVLGLHYKRQEQKRTGRLAIL
jgi:hypothetical protein